MTMPNADALNADAPDVPRRYALVADGGDVVNVMMWDGNVMTWTPPDGHFPIELADDDVVSPGDTYAGGKFVTTDPLPDAPGRVLLDRDAIRARLTTAKSIAELKVIIGEVLDVQEQQP